MVEIIKEQQDDGFENVPEPLLEEDWKAIYAGYLKHTKSKNSFFDLAISDLKSIF